MSDFLCLRFRDTEITPTSQVAWSIVSASARIEDSGHALLADMAQTVSDNEAGRRCIVIVSSESVLLTSVELPAKQHRHSKQLVPFLVEEQIIDPIEAMHLAMPVLHSGDEIAVAAVKRKLLADWLEQLAAVNIAPDFLLVDVFCVPAQANQWQLLFDEDRVLFRDGALSGMRLDRQTASTVLKLAIAAQSQSVSEGASGALQQVALVQSTSDDAEMAARIALQQRRDELTTKALLDHASDASADPFEAALVGDDFTNSADGFDDSTDEDDGEDDGIDGDARTQGSQAWLHEIDDFVRSENIETKVVNYSETVSQLLAVSAVQSLDRNLNILQGDFRPATANAANRRYMRKISMAVAACVAVFMTITLGGGAYLNYQADSYYDQSVVIYRSLFPKQRKVMDPVKQMQRQLRGATVGGTTSDFLPLLDAASRSLAGLDTQGGEEPSIKQLRYDVQRGLIAIDLHASNIDQLEAYRDLLTNEGLDVDILSANQDGDTIKGRIQVGRS
ncbi:type II secretion system protein GspL [bacterium]|nr:type II secretion system protein GspL [bacterium]